MGTPDAARLPRSWTKTARSGVLHAVSLAFVAVTSAWGAGTTCKRAVTRLKAELERAIRSIKSECTRQIRVPLGHEAMRREIVFYAAWYNERRPHQALGGVTLAEQYDEGRSQGRGDPVEPRPRWPAQDGAVRVTRVCPVVKSLEGRQHLPIIELRRVA